MVGYNRILSNIIPAWLNKTCMAHFDGATNIIDPMMALLFTEPVPRPIQSISHHVRLLSVDCPLLETALPGGPETSGRRAYH